MILQILSLLLTLLNPTSSLVLLPLREVIKVSRHFILTVKLRAERSVQNQLFLITTPHKWNLKGCSIPKHVVSIEQTIVTCLHDTFFLISLYLSFNFVIEAVPSPSLSYVFALTVNSTHIFLSKFLISIASPLKISSLFPFYNFCRMFEVNQKWEKKIRNT